MVKKSLLKLKNNLHIINAKLMYSFKYIMLPPSYQLAGLLEAYSICKDLYQNLLGKTKEDGKSCAYLIHKILDFKGKSFDQRELSLENISPTRVTKLNSPREILTARTKKIDGGSFGDIFITDRPLKNQMLIKRIVMKNISTDSGIVISLISEIASNKYIGYNETLIVPEKIYVDEYDGKFYVSEEMKESGINMFKLSKTLDIEEKKKILKENIKDIFIALKLIHDHGFIHGDVKSENILYNGTLHICDFGSIKRVVTSRIARCYTPCTAPPEYFIFLKTLKIQIMLQFSTVCRQDCTL